MDDDALATLDRIIAKSLASAGEVIRHSFPPEERLTAAEVVEFWGGRRLAALATVSPARRAHALPLLVYLHGARFYFQSEPGAVKMRDVRANPAAALVAWSPDGRIAVMVQGTAREIPPEQRAGLPDGLLRDGPYGPAAIVEVTPTRITAKRGGGARPQGAARP